MLTIDYLLDLLLEKQKYQLKDKKLYNPNGKIILDGSKIRNYNTYTKTSNKIGI